MNPKPYHGIDMLPLAICAGPELPLPAVWPPAGLEVLGAKLPVAAKENILDRLKGKAHTWPKAPVPISHCRPSGRRQISMSCGLSSQSLNGTRGRSRPPFVSFCPSPASPFAPALQNSPVSMRGPGVLKGTRGRGPALCRQPRRRCWRRNCVVDTLRGSQDSPANGMP